MSWTFWYYMTLIICSTLVSIGKAGQSRGDYPEGVELVGTVVAMWLLAAPILWALA